MPAVQLLRAFKRMLNRNTSAYWDGVYRRKIAAGRAPRRDSAVLRLLPLLHDKRCILDFGGGLGAVIATLSQEVSSRRFCLVDHSPEALAYASGRLGRSDERGNAFEYAAHLEEAQGPFDAILCIEVLEHLTDHREILDQLWSRLAPGGILLLSVPVKGWRDGNREHVNKFTVDSMFRLLSKYGEWIQIAPRTYSRKSATLSTAFFAVPKGDDGAPPQGATEDA